MYNIRDLLYLNLFYFNQKNIFQGAIKDQIEIEIVAFIIIIRNTDLG